MSLLQTGREAEAIVALERASASDTGLAEINAWLREHPG